MSEEEELHTTVSDLDTTQTSSTLRNLKPEFLNFVEPLTAKTNNHLIKLDEPCEYLKIHKKIRILHVGDFKIDQVIDDKHFTIELDDRHVPMEIIVTGIESDDSGVPILEEVNMEIKDVTNNDIVNTINLRVKLIENTLASLIQRLEALENM